jgi:hypothetical protein
MRRRQINLVSPCNFSQGSDTFFLVLAVSNEANFRKKWCNDNRYNGFRLWQICVICLCACLGLYCAARELSPFIRHNLFSKWMGLKPKFGSSSTYTCTLLLLGFERIRIDIEVAANIWTQKPTRMITKLWDYVWGNKPF